MKAKARKSSGESRLARAVSESLEPRTLLSASLQFVHEPTSGMAGATLSPAIEVELVNGPANDTSAITLSITLPNGNATTATLGGTVTENLTQGLVNGVAATIATFPANLNISEAGSYTLTASDAADGVFVQDTPITISDVATTTTITSSANPATAGNDLTLTFTVSPTSSTNQVPAGNVVITDTSGNHDTSLPLNGSGQAQLVVYGGLPVGSDTFNASYQGDPSFTGSTATPFVQSTAQYATTTTITSSANPATNGNDLTLTFTVASTTQGVGATPAGYVNISDTSGNHDTSVPLNGSGQATLVIFGGLPVGTDTFTAGYAGDPAFLASTGHLTQSTVQYNTTTTITSSANPATNGNDLTLTFTVASTTQGVGTPAGYVNVTDSNGKYNTNIQLSTSGVGTLVIYGGLALGSDTFTAGYLGDAAFLASTGKLVQTTVQYATTTTITSSSNPATQGADLTLTFTVASTTQGIGTPAGYVNISDTLNAHDTSLQLSNSGQAQLVVYGGLPLGMDTFTASYAGDPAFLASTGHLTQSTVQYNTSTTITTSANPATAGNDLTLTFAVASTTQGIGTPAGYVNISDTLNEHDTSLKLDDSGKATLVVYGGLPVGSDTFTAVYQGDAAFLTSTGTLKQNTVQYATTTTISTSANPATAGEDLTLTITVVSNTPDIGTPGGDVQVTDTDGKYNDQTISLNSSGQAFLYVTGGLLVGTDKFTASYEGEGGGAFLPSVSGQLTQTTVQYNTTTTITSSANPATNGNDLTLTFTVASTTSGVGTPAGYVNISDTNNAHDTSLLLNSSGQATLVIYGGLPVGSDTFTANYAGEPAFLGSSGTLKQTTVQYATTTSITSSANPATVGNDLTLTFTVATSASGVGMPAGYVAVTDTGGKYNNSNIPLNSSGVGTLVIYGGLSAGMDTFTAKYLGDSAFLSSTATSLVQQTVQYNTTTTITSSANPATAGNDLTLTFAVASTTSDVGTPAGNVYVYDSLGKYGTTIPLTNGQATLIAYGGLAVGSDTFTAIYQGDAAFVTSTSAPFTQSTVQYNTTTKITSSANPATVGNDLTLTFTVASTTTGVGMPAGYVAISDSNGNTHLNTSVQLNSSGVGTLVIYGGLPAGTDNITATYQSDPAFLGSTGTLDQSTGQLAASATVNWTNPADITYGTALSSAQLDATSNVPGKFVYTPALGTILHAGADQTLSVVFTPTDTTDYKVVDASVQINVLKATPEITWANPADIPVDTALGAAQLDATANVGGKFVYTPVAGTVLSLGDNQTLSAAFTPTDTADYNDANATAQINVVKITPVITWANPVTITYGTALSSKQLDAAHKVLGTLVYTPALGTILSAGQDQMLSVTFTPSNMTDYSVVTATAQINVNKAALTITANPATQVYGSPTPTFTDTIAGFVNGDTASVLSGTAALITTATSASSVGKYTITAAVGSLSAANYSFAVYKNSTLTITKAPLTVTANDASRIYGAANPKFTATLTGFVNGDTASVVSGSPALTPHASAASSVGDYAITAAAGSLKALNYSFTTFPSGTLTITQAPLTVTANAATKVYGAAIPTFTYTITGFVNRNTKTVVSGTATLSTTATSASPVGGYDVTAAIGSLSATNYSFNTFNTGTLSVTKAPLTVTADNATKVYGDALPALTDTITGFVNGDTDSIVSGTAALTTHATSASPVGSYVITAALGSLTAANYSFPILQSGMLSITKAALTVTANDASRVQGVANPHFTYTITGFVNGDTPAAVSGSAKMTTTAIASTPMGMYAITIALGTLTSKNYLFSEFVDGTLTIT